MLRSAMSFYVLGIITLLLGSYGLAGLNTEIGKDVLIISLFFFAILFLGGIALDNRETL